MDSTEEQAADSLEQQKAEVSWKPIAYAGASFRTHRLVESASGLRYRPQPTSFLLPMIGVLLSGACFVYMISLYAAGGPDAPKLYAFLLPIVFLAACAWRYYQLFNEVNDFNLTERYYFYGLSTQRSLQDPENYCPFDNIIAIQLLAEYVKPGNDQDSFEERRKRKNYTSYELNLVLKNGNRMNVVDHGSLEKLKIEARIIATHLDVPLWVQENIERI